MKGLPVPAEVGLAALRARPARPHRAAASRRRAPLLVPLLVPLLAGLLASAAGVASAAPPTPNAVPVDESPQALLQRMSRMLATRSYDGEFLHMAGGRIERLQVIHRRDARGVVERLRVLGESGREIIRQGDELRVYLPAERRVLVDRAPPGDGSARSMGPLGRLPAFDAGLDRHYLIALEGRETSVIGRPARVILVRPRDSYRLGYRLWIDERTAMPTRTDLFDAEGRVVEQLVFTSLRLRSRIDDAELQPAPALRGFTAVHQGPPPPPPPGGLAPAPAERWGLARLPPGFRIARRGLQWLPGNPAPAAHLVVTDGLATVSVFVQRTPPGRRQIEGPGRLGAASAYSTVVDGHQVTAVGEVPARTVEAIARQVVPE